MSHPDVIVVGGGLGGLGVAFSLTRQGHSVRVLESAPAFGEVGAGIQLAPNCTRILDDYGLLEEARRLGVVPDSMVMRDAVDGAELTRLDLRDLEKRYGYPYLVIHRSDLHGLLLRACERVGVELITDAQVTSYENTDGGARVTLASGATHEAGVVIAADGLHSIARKLLVDDEPLSSAYVAYRGTVPAALPRVESVDLGEVAVYVGPACHFVHYGLRGGELLNQVAVFESPKALAGQEDWGARRTRCRLRQDLRLRPGRPAVHVAGQVVADVRPGPDHELGPRPDIAARRLRPPAAPVHRAGSDHGDRGRLGAG